MVLRLQNHENDTQTEAMGVWLEVLTLVKKHFKGPLFNCSHFLNA